MPSIFTFSNSLITSLHKSPPQNSSTLFLSIMGYIGINPLKNKIQKTRKTIIQNKAIEQVILIVTVAIAFDDFILVSPEKYGGGCHCLWFKNEKQRCFESSGTRFVCFNRLRFVGYYFTLSLNTDLILITLSIASSIRES